VNDACLMMALAYHYHHGEYGLLQDHAKAMELYTRAADLGNSKAHDYLADICNKGGYMKKAKLHCEAAAMAGNEAARCNLGTMEAQSGNMERAVKHWTIAASAGEYQAMYNLIIAFNKGLVSRNAMDSTLTAYNNSCVEMRSEARDAYIRLHIDYIGER
jgi:TPR repeat protein